MVGRLLGHSQPRPVVSFATGQCTHANWLATVSDSVRYLRTAYDLPAVVTNGGGMRCDITSLKTDARYATAARATLPGFSQMEPDGRAWLNLGLATASGGRAA